MRQNAIGFVLNASHTCPQPPFIADAHFLRVPVNDSFCEKILPWLDRSLDFIGGSLLVLLLLLFLLLLPLHFLHFFLLLLYLLLILLFLPLLLLVLLLHLLLLLSFGAPWWLTPASALCRESQGLQQSSPSPLPGRHLPLSHHRHCLYNEEDGPVPGRGLPVSYH